MYIEFFSLMLNYIKPFSFVLFLIVIAYISLKSSNSESIDFWKKTIKILVIIEIILTLWAISMSLIEIHKQPNNSNNNILSTAPNKKY